MLKNEAHGLTLSNHVDQGGNAKKYLKTDIPDRPQQDEQKDKSTIITMQRKDIM
jgi:hypothetical protein